MRWGAHNVRISIKGKDREDSDEVGCYAMECNQTPIQSATSKFSCAVGYASHLIYCYEKDPD